MANVLMVNVPAMQNVILEPATPLANVLTVNVPAMQNVLLEPATPLANVFRILLTVCWNQVTGLKP
jgi:hypothetical protein